MRSLVILLAVVAVAVGKPALFGLGYHARSYIHSPAAYSRFVSPVTISSQYHAQDELGQYSYGYAGGPSAKSEVKSWDGVTRGGYSYVDAEGKLQNVNYIADPINGFRVAATNLPVAPEAVPAAPLEAPEPVEDTPEVAAAKEAHFALYAEAKAAADAAPDDPEPIAAVAAPASVIPAATYPAYHGSFLPYHYHAAPASRFAFSYAAPAYYHTPASYYGGYRAPIAAAPYAYAAPHVISSQYHAQDELGQYSYGYSGGPSSKSEVKSWDGVTRGGYSYVDAEGKIQSVNYIADPINGFRVAGTNLPVAPDAPVLQTVPDTEEVAAAKAEHLAAVQEAKNRVAE